MAKHRGSGDWLVLEEMLERGDPAFVDAIRAFHDADVLASFAARWYGDKRMASRRLLLEYLDRPLSAYRHEALVKRLFKAAEAAGDDEAMGRFLVLFDRTIRREVSRRAHFESRITKSRAEAEELIARWNRLGPDNNVTSWEDSRGQIHFVGRWSEPVIRMPPGTTMPRNVQKYRNPRTGEIIPDIGTRLGTWFRKSLAGAPVPPRMRKRLDRLRLFSVATRQYLRRRAWRYFRRLGRSNPERYVPAVVRALVRYMDDDVSDGLALIDNWSLIHVLFHRSPVLVARPAGWALAEDRTLEELAPAPIYERLWERSPRAIVDLLIMARCRPVRQWAIQMVRRHEAARATIGLDELLTLLGHEDPDVVALVAELLRQAKGLDTLSVERWLAVVETAAPTALEVVVELMRLHLGAESLTLEQVVRLTASRPVPLARLGLDWLKSHQPHDEADCRALLSLTEARCESLRSEIAQLVRERLTTTSRFESSWVLEFLDSRHAAVRTEGTAWFRAERRARDEVGLWRCLLESPHDDVRFFLISELESRVAGRDIERLASVDAGPESLRLLWASVLLNVHRGSRAKPGALRQAARWIDRRPEDADSLLPLLAAALRSARGPERRAGLAAIAQLVARRPDTASRVRSSIPELKLL
jgi:hypothetical protein